MSIKSSEINLCLKPNIDLLVDPRPFSIQLPDAVLNQANKVLSEQPRCGLDPIELLRRKINYRQGSSLLLQGGIHKAFPALDICTCALVSNRARSFLQFASLEKVGEIYKDKMQQITVVSIGAGACLQEAEMLVRLKQAGYQNIKFILVDPSSLTSRAAEELRKLDSKVEVIYFKSLEDYAAIGQQNASLVFLIDLQSKTPDGNTYDSNSGQRNLTQHSFHFLREHNMLQDHETVVSFTEIDHKACSGIYTNETKELNQLHNSLEWAKLRRAAQIPIDS